MWALDDDAARGCHGVGRQIGFLFFLFLQLTNTTSLWVRIYGGNMSELYVSL